MPNYLDDLHVRGTLSAERFRAPVESITNDNIISAAGIEPGKVIHQFTFEYDQRIEFEVIARTQFLHIVRGDTGTVQGIQACITDTIATGSDRTVSVDLLKSTGGDPPVSILTSTIDFDDASDLYVPVDGLISDSDLEVGDLLQLAITVDGKLLEQAHGLHVTVTISEDP